MGEQFQRIGHWRLWQLGADLFQRVRQRAELAGVDAGGGVVLGGIEAQKALDLAARKALTHRFAEVRFEIAQGIGKAEVGLQVALVHGAQFELQAAPVGLMGLAGEGGHAVGHGNSLNRRADRSSVPHR